jgi:predicted flavoprotein YhiN
MAAGLGFKDFVTGEVLTAADVDGYLMQGVWVFASAAARDAAVTSPQEGNFAYLKDTNVTTYYTGSAWANLDTTGMTNPMTTTGDTIYSSSGSTPARLGIGSTGQVLTVAAGIPSWATPSASGFVGCSLTKSANQSVNNTTATAITFDTELKDTNAFHDNSTNTSRITIPSGKAGFYLISGQINFASNSTGVRDGAIYKNGTVMTQVFVLGAANGGWTGASVSQIQELAVADYIELFAYQNSGGALNVNGGSTYGAAFQVQYLGA